ncbi:MAG: GtrA family protein [Rhodoglobus sp.]|nr:GtrA family protein [Rhodoglobus sp.]
MRALLNQFVRFGIVGLGGLVVDVAVFNILRLTVLAPEVLHEGPVIAKVISTSLAIIANWMGNRYWTFGTERRLQAWREGVEFTIVSIAGMGIGLLCLWVSHYVLGYTSLLADNVASNVIGLALGTAFRFTFYRLWVFNPRFHGPRAVEHTMRPAGVSPLGRVQAVATVDDRAHRDD